MSRLAETAKDEEKINRPPRIEDVAKAASVSSATVSRVLNDKPVRDSTRKAVRDAIKRLNYSPNIHARGLMMKRAFSVGVLVPSMDNAYYRDVVDGIMHKFEDQQLPVLMGETDEHPDREARLVRAFADRRVDGIVLVDSPRENISNGLLESIAKRIPLVLINGDGHVDGSLTVCVDHVRAAQVAMNYLIDKGKKRILFVRGEEGYAFNIKERAFLDYDTGWTRPESPVVRLSDANHIRVVSHVQAPAIEWLCSNERPQAVFASNDLLGIGVIKAALSVGLSIPEDLAVISSGNTMLAEVSPVRLTSVDTRGRELGETAARFLLDRFESEGFPMDRVVLNPTVFPRDSA